MKDFAGKIAFITGGASGAGFGQAQIFSEAGMKVVIADVRQDHIDEAMAYFKKTGAPVHAINLDITDRAAYAAAADETEAVFGSSPDLLIMTAGVNTFGPVEASTYEDFDWVIGVNLGGVINGLVTFVPRMIKAGRGGYIATTVSYGAFGASPGVAPYITSKIGVLSLMECYAMALKSYGIGVSALCPANINSNIPDAALKTRPEHLKNTGYNITEATQAVLASSQKNGMDPRVLADWLKKGIENDQFLIVPYKSAARMLEIDMARYYTDYLQPDSMTKYEERRMQPPTDEQKQIFFEKEGYELGSMMRAAPGPDVGFGKARSDIDWVAPEKRAK
ncbi:MAG: SDR family NAD(P)-dependent oxidoreductase [Oscillospiraceae bacterium]|nr:SDR family NAD(P)-dependent oxidoreductase [Oscillospiraceae bacterium]